MKVINSLSIVFLTVFMVLVFAERGVGQQSQLGLSLNKSSLLIHKSTGNVKTVVDGKFGIGVQYRKIGHSKFHLGVLADFVGADIVSRSSGIINTYQKTFNGRLLTLSVSGIKYFSTKDYLQSKFGIELHLGYNLPLVYEGETDAWTFGQRTINNSPPMSLMFNKFKLGFGLRYKIVDFTIKDRMGTVEFYSHLDCTTLFRKYSNNISYIQSGICCLFGK
jgi:hypothetical protein